MVQGVNGSQVYQRNSRCIFKAHVVGDDMHTVNGTLDTIHICAAPHAGNTISNLELGDSRSDALDDTSTLAANRVLILWHNAHGSCNVLFRNIKVLADYTYSRHA